MGPRPFFAAGLPAAPAQTPRGSRMPALRLGPAPFNRASRGKPRVHCRLRHQCYAARAAKHSPPPPPPDQREAAAKAPAAPAKEAPPPQAAAGAAGLHGAARRALREAGTSAAASLRASVAAALRPQGPGGGASASARESRLLLLRRSAETLANLGRAVAAAEAGALGPAACTSALWAAGALSQHSGALEAEVEALAAAFARLGPAKLRRAEAFVLVDASWALAAASHDAPAAFEAIAAACDPPEGEGVEAGGDGGAGGRTPLAGASPSQLATLLRSCAAVCGPAAPARAVARIASRAIPADPAAAAARLRAWAPNNLACGLWALSAAHEERSHAFAALWAELGSRCGGPGGCSPLRPDSLVQIHQASFSAEDASVSGLPPLPAELVSAAAAQWARISRATAPSGKQRELQAALLSLGLAAEAEACAAGYSVDFAVALPGGWPEGRGPSGEPVRVAVEMDGPTHFTRNTRQPLGATQLKRRHLAARGWRVLSVPLWEWDAIAGSTPERAAYVKAKLESLLLD